MKTIAEIVKEISSTEIEVKNELHYALNKHKFYMLDSADQIAIRLTALSVFEDDDYPTHVDLFKEI